jgi:periplasmic protein TonB
MGFLKMKSALVLIGLVAATLLAGPAYATPQGGAKSDSNPPTVRVGGDIKPPVKVKGAPPIYPPYARQEHIQGSVIVEATIGVDGKVKDTKVVRGVNLLLDGAAVAAVRTWEFKPTLVNGQAVQVITTIPLNFTLD